MLRYEHIEYLNFLFGIPVLILAMLLYNRWKATALTPFWRKQISKRTHAFVFQTENTNKEHSYTSYFYSTHYWNCQPASRYKNGRSKKRGCGFNDSH